MSLPEREDNLTELDRRLYSRASGNIPVRRSPLSPPTEAGKREWHLRQATAQVRPRRPRVWSVSFLWKIFLGTAAFFVLALVVAGFFLFGGANVVSNQNINLAVTGPITIKSGEVFDLGIAVTNKNRSALQTADLIIEYPPGTRDPNDPQRELGRVREALGEIRPGQTVVHGVRAILFGSEKSRSAVTVRLTYRLAGSNAVFEKEEPFAVNIADSPVSLNLVLPPDVNAGKEISATVEVLSNSPTVLKEVGLLALWPPGFKLLESSVPAESSAGETLWRLGDLPPGGRRSFMVRGTLNGQAEELKSFRFQVGLLERTSRAELAAIYTDSFKSVLIKQPFVGLMLAVNNQLDEEVVARLGETLRLTIDWVNNLDIEIMEGELNLSLEGPVNRAAVDAGEGFYHSADNVLTWGASTLPSLSSLKPADRGRVQATLATTAFNQAIPIKNPVLELTLSFRGRKNEAGFSREMVETKVERVIKLEAVFAPAARTLYQEGPFENLGPVPPRVDQETTYTVEWGLLAGGNDVKEAVLIATLPPNVTWLDEVSPSTEKIVWNEVNRRLTWEAGYLATGSRGEVRGKKVAFKLKIKPSISQVEEPAPLLTGVMARGVDAFTGTTLERNLEIITTDFSTDPAFRANDDKVLP